MLLAIAAFGALLWLADRDFTACRGARGVR